MNTFLRLEFFKFFKKAKTILFKSLFFKILNNFIEKKIFFYKHNNHKKVTKCFFFKQNIYNLKFDIHFFYYKGKF
jgi:hypothetical protein